MVGARREKQAVQDPRLATHESQRTGQPRILERIRFIGGIEADLSITGHAHAVLRLFCKSWHPLRQLRLSPMQVGWRVGGEEKVEAKVEL